MSSEKKGFSGLNDLVSDISGDLARPYGNQEPVRSETPPQPARPAKPSRSPQSSSPPQGGQPAIQKGTQPQPDGNRGWGIAIAVLVVIVAIAVAIGGGKDAVSPSSQSSAPSAPPPSPYVQGIPNASSEQARLIDALLQAGQSGDASTINNAAAATEASSKKPALDKTVIKDSRAANKTGLQYHKEGHDALAATYFLEAYKTNPFDPEIAENLGIALYNVGDYAAAKKAYYAALLRSSRRASAWSGLAKVFALNHSLDKAANSFALAFHFSKSPTTLRRTLLASYREEKTPAVKDAMSAALAANYSATVVAFLKPILGNLAGVRIPVYLPTTFKPLNYEGNPLEPYALNNGIFGIQASADSYHIPVGSEADCRVMACGLGAISARRALPTDTDEGDPVELEGGIKGVIVRGAERETDHLVFRIGDVRYSFNLGAVASADVDAARSALKLGAIPVEVLGGLPKITMAPPPPAEPIAQYPAAPPTPTPASSYVRPPSNPYCTTSYDILLETFGEGVTVELRSGFPGNSHVIAANQSFGGNVHFSGLCAGSYFLAIGNSDSVSVTPVRHFENEMEYRSTIRMQRGSGNVSSKRRADL